MLRANVGNFYLALFSRFHELQGQNVIKTCKNGHAVYRFRNKILIDKLNRFKHNPDQEEQIVITERNTDFSDIKKLDTFTVIFVVIFLNMIKFCSSKYKPQIYTKIP